MFNNLFSSKCWLLTKLAQTNTPQPSYLFNFEGENLPIFYSNRHNTVPTII